MLIDRFDELFDADPRILYNLIFRFNRFLNFSVVELKSELLLYRIQSYYDEHKYH